MLMLSTFRRLPRLVRFAIFYFLILYVLPLFISDQIASAITFLHRFLFASILTYLSQVAIKEEKPFQPEVIVESKVLGVSPAIIQGDLITGAKEFELIISSDSMEVVTE